MHIRSAELADIPDMTQLNLEAQALHVRLEPTRYRPVTDPSQVAALLREKLQQPCCGALVALDGEALVGLAVWEERRREATALTTATHTLHVDQLAVASTHRGRGVGRALMRACEAHARRLGCTQVNLLCRWSNDDARAFYDAIGYQPSQVVLARSLPETPDSAT